MGLDAMRLYRMARRLHLQGVPVVPDVLRRAIYMLHNAYIPQQAEIGEGTQLGYGGMGIVIHKASRVGKHCLISQQVTIGGRSGSEGVPVIGDYVRIGSGAKVLGNVRIGDYAVVGANAVVTRDVPAGAVVAGVPARVLRQDPDPLASYRRDLGLAPPVLAPDGKPPAGPTLQ